MIGSESELVARLNVSRPTFRQAVRLIEQEQLLVIKRGVGGGFFVRKPETSAVSHMAGVFLQTRKATVADALAAAFPLFGELARAAAIRTRPAVRASLMRFAAQEKYVAADFESLRLAERAFLEVFAAASGNPVLELYATVLMNFVGSFIGRGGSLPSSERIEAYRDARIGLVRAILSGDQEVARVMALRWSDALLHCLEGDIPRRRVQRTATITVASPAEFFPSTRMKSRVTRESAEGRQTSRPPS
jgi:DNA-binding FadR family transcriptional regulator